MTSSASIHVKPCLLIVMGVSGSGKSTVAKGLQQKLNWPFMEGDDLHPKHNIQKMSKNIPLDDEDRWPWLVKCHEWLKTCEHSYHGRGILTCSALKKIYREKIIRNLRDPHCFIFLEASISLLEKRLKNRSNHFMPASLLTSQLKTLEPPEQDERFISADMAQPLEKILVDILFKLSEDYQKKAYKR